MPDEFQPVPRPDDFAPEVEATGSDSTTVVVNAAGTDALQDVIENIPAIVEESKAGYKTTEFWLTIVSSLLVVFDGIPLPEKFEGAYLAVVSAFYILSRGLAKKGVPRVTPVVPPPA